MYKTGLCDITNGVTFMCHEKKACADALTEHLVTVHFTSAEALSPETVN